MNIASSRKEFESNPEAFQGFIERRLKRSVDLTVNNKLYTINTHGVLCSRRRLEDGKVWYSFCSSDAELFQTLRETAEFVERFVVNRDAKGLIFNG